MAMVAATDRHFLDAGKQLKTPFFSYCLQPKAVLLNRCSAEILAKTDTTQDSLEFLKHSSRTRERREVVAIGTV
jgi:hypothetical protein